MSDFLPSSAQAQDTNILPDWLKRLYENFVASRKDELSSLDVEYQDSKLKIAQDSHFINEVIRKNIIIDKSLVIETLIRTQKALVAFPRRWGKSFNLGMVKAFLELELDDFGTPLPDDLCINRKLFQKAVFDQTGQRVPMSIMNNVDLVNQHFGKYIVLKLDFQNMSGCFAQIFRLLSRLISQLYQQFEYAKWLAKPHHFLIFKQGIECYHAPMTTESISFLKNSLKHLAWMLHTYYNKEIAILVDEYDCPSNNIFQMIDDKNEQDRALSLIKDLLDNAINDQPHVRFVMLTGVLHLGKDASLCPLNNSQEYSMVRPGPFAPFYGFTHDEINQLFQLLRFDNDYLVQVQKMYNGHRFNTADSVYNPWALACCLNSATRNRLPSLGHTIRPYWTESGCIRFIYPLLLHSLMLQKLGQLLNSAKGTTNFNLIDPMCSHEMDILRDILTHQQSFDMNEHQVDILFSYLCHQGYFNIDSINDSNECTISLPNLEIKKEFDKLVYYAIHRASDLKSTSIIKWVIEEFVKGNAEVQAHILERFGQSLQANFQDFILQLPKFALFQPQHHHEHDNEDIIHCLLASIIMDEFTALTINNRRGCDVCFTHQDLAVVIELKYEGTAHDALQQIHDKGYYDSLVRDYARQCLIGLNVNKNKDVSVAIEFYDRNRETPLTYPIN